MSRPLGEGAGSAIGRVLLVGDGLAPLSAAIEGEFGVGSAVTAATSAAALALLDAGGIDCVLVGHDPPDPDGIALAAECRERFPETPVVVGLPDGDPAAVEAALEAGATDVVEGWVGTVPTGLLARRIENVVRTPRDGEDGRPDDRDGVSDEPGATLKTAATAGGLERAFTYLRTFAGRLRTATTVDEVLETVASAGGTFFPGARVDVYRFEAADGVLRPVDAGPPVEPDDETFRWNAFLGPGFVPAFEREAARVAGMAAAPLGDAGVLSVESGDGEPLPEATVRLVALIGVVAAGALDRVACEDRLGSRRRELDRWTSRLDRLDDAVRLLLGAGAAITDATTRDGLEQGICDALVDPGGYEFAWVAAVGEDGELLPRAWAGAEADYLDSVDLAPDADPPEPAVRAVRDREPVVVPNVVEGVREAPWRRELVTRGINAVLSLPLEREGPTDGVLTVCSTRRSAFDPFARRLLSAVAAWTAHGLRCLEREQAGEPFFDELVDRLTERQREVIETAYRNGYFEWPREHTGEEVAALLGISQPTFNNHLRVAEAKLLALLFERGDAGDEYT